MAGDIGALKAAGLTALFIGGVMAYFIATDDRRGSVPQGEQTANTAAKGDRQAQITTPKPDTKAEPEPPPQPKPGQQVSEDYFRWLLGKVHFDCQQQIKRSVTSNMRAEGLLYGKNEIDSMHFYLQSDRSTKVVRDDNTITIAGDKAEIQNDFGNWVRASYMCKVNVDTKTVVDAFVSPGRFPN
jgi:hypothetical protein